MKNYRTTSSPTGGAKEEKAEIVENSKSCIKNYPSSVFYILGNEFCERFSYYGMKAILVIYLKEWLDFDSTNSTAIYHAFTMLCYLTPLLGGFICDSWLGKYRTILYMSILYGCGNILMSFTAFPPAERVGPIIALLLIALGTGGIKPCVVAFGGDQFNANQKKELNGFFSMFYFMINLGSLASMLLTPVLRSSVTCFGGDCYPLAFGVPAILMITSLVVFVCGKNQYKIYPPTGNIFVKVCKCIVHALSKKWCSKSYEQRGHWLDYAEDKFEVKFIDEVKAVLRVLVLFLPLPVFWALFDQQGSRWTLQAILMNGDMGALGHLEPDQMQAINPVLIILFIPFFDKLVYPIFEKCNILKKPLTRMSWGMLLAGLAFVITGLLQLKIQAGLDDTIQSDAASIDFINASPCPIKIDSMLLKAPLHVAHGTEKIHTASGVYSATFSAVKPCPYYSNNVSANYNIQQKGRYHLFIAGMNNKLQAKLVKYSVDKPKSGGALVTLFYATNTFSGNTQVFLKGISNGKRYSFNISEFEPSTRRELAPGIYEIYAPVNMSSSMKLSNKLALRSGGVYTIVLQHNVSNPAQVQLVDYVDSQPNVVPLLWQIPQYVTMTMGEILFSISGLSFAYSQAPASMKAVLQAGWLMTTAGGNLIVIIVSESRLIENQAVEFFLFAGLMFVTMLIFSAMAYFYKYVNYDTEYSSIEDTDTEGLFDSTPSPESEINTSQKRESGI